MSEEKQQQIIHALQQVIDDTRHTIDRFEATGMDEQMPVDYDRLFGILDDANRQQRQHTLLMLGSA
ncbi:hypothetical protein F0A17_02240 [Billgrantia pellis]|uniref:DUF2383 domain-containing protein n=1 Tax=Billgrantia pellis TaxID=2606936 RepID=A0A7V7G2X6_9GAMM|nr:hypothetical protein [Halomonas pellis]KAA0014489.1 hypothetical protein F0A17_02240 [Halomonas pellis]